MKINIRALLAGECRRLPIDYTLSVPPVTDDCLSNLYGVRFPSPMKVQGELVNQAGYMRMGLDLSLDYIAPCARCLTDVNGTFSFHLEKTVATRAQLADLNEDTIDEYAIPEDGYLDLDDELLELLELEFPMRILCREDCRGLCPKCGHDLNTGPCSCSDKQVDPRLAPLADILAEMQAKEESEYSDS